MSLTEELATDADILMVLQVYVLLMRLLISPPENWLVGITPSAPLQPDLETALSLLEGNAERIPPLKALKELPDSVPLIRIKHFLTTALHKQLSERRNTQVLKGLTYAEHLQVCSYKQIHCLSVISCQCFSIFSDIILDSQEHEHTQVIVSLIVWFINVNTPNHVSTACDFPQAIF